MAKYWKTNLESCVLIQQNTTVWFYPKNITLWPWHSFAIMFTCNLAARISSSHQLWCKRVFDNTAKRITIWALEVSTLHKKVPENWQMMNTDNKNAALQCSYNKKQTVPQIWKSWINLDYGMALEGKLQSWKSKCMLASKKNSNMQPNSFFTKKIQKIHSKKIRKIRNKNSNLSVLHQKQIWIQPNPVAHRMLMLWAEYWVLIQPVISRQGCLTRSKYFDRGSWESDNDLNLTMIFLL